MDYLVPVFAHIQRRYSDRQENVGYEVRAGLSSVYATKGWVADDIHSESASRTLDYACWFSLTNAAPLVLTKVRPDDDYAVSVFAGLLGKTQDFHFFRNRSTFAPSTIFNNATGFMEARSASGDWAGPDNGWTEGDKWAYSFDVVHAVQELITLRGGKANFVRSLDEHFDGGEFLDLASRNPIHWLQGTTTTRTR